VRDHGLRQRIWEGGTDMRSRQLAKVNILFQFLKMKNTGGLTKSRMQ
jgi:hypothetical protein